MKKLVYTVQGFGSEEQRALLESLLPEALRAYGSDGKVEADLLGASVTFSVPRNVSCAELEQSVNAVLSAHGMELLTPPGVRYYAYAGPKKKAKTVSVSAFVTSLIAAVSVTLVITMLLTALVSTAYWNGKGLGGLLGGNSSDELVINDRTLSLVDQLIRDYAYDGVDQEAMMDAVIKAYVAATGDIYAEYYTKEEFDALTQESQGKMEGIGVSVINGSYEGMTAIKLIMVYPGSPAEAAGLKPGDLIVALKYQDELQSVDALGGYTMAVNHLRGAAGTKAEFLVMRPSGSGYEQIEFAITRAAFEAVSVTGKVSKTDPEVGIVTIIQFDLPTPEQFEATVDDLIAKGCTKFVFDVRNNPGGDLESIKAIQSYFLSEGDLLVSTKDKHGNEKKEYVKAVRHTSPAYSVCDVTVDEIGKYKNLTFCVLTNGNTASAAELFTATMRDYKLGTIVGETTYGKGCMQSIYDLSRTGPYYKLYGVEGGLKLTTQMYFPACGESYHDIGIAPHVEVKLPAEVMEQYTMYDLPEELDTQLQAALEQMK
jgi:carboxyl-terminal processing protease